MKRYFEVYEGKIKDIYHDYSIGDVINTSNVNIVIVNMLMAIFFIGYFTEQRKVEKMVI